MAIVDREGGEAGAAEATRGTGASVGTRGFRVMIEAVSAPGLNRAWGGKGIEVVNTLRDRNWSGVLPEPITVVCPRCGAEFRLSLDMKE